MTRRGSLAYYLASWVCGVFFFSFVRVLAQPAYEDFPLALLMAFFIMSAVAWPTLILFAFLLRIITKALSIQDAARWIATGGALAILFGAVFSPFQRTPATALRSWINFQARLFTLTGFSENPYDFGWKVNALATALAGMATAYVLFRIDRAFAPREDASR